MTTHHPGSAAEGVDGDELSAIRRSVAELGALRMTLAERNVELRKLQSEYESYRRRVDRDRERVAREAVFTSLEPVLDVLDSQDRAREHGPLSDDLQALAEQLELAVARRDVVRFGAEGDAFDPTCHQAVQHVGTDPAVGRPTCRRIARTGYRMGDTVMRAAQVLVVDPG